MPLPAAAVPWLGPAAMATAKALAIEYLPAVSSATLGVILTRLAWNRCVPEWIRQDVTFEKTFTTPKRRSKRSIKDGEEEKKDYDDDYNQEDANELERLSSVIEKIQGLMVSAEEKIFGRRSSREEGPAVPFIYASLLAYIQLSAQLKRIAMSTSCEPSMATSRKDNVPLTSSAPLEKESSSISSSSKTSPKFHPTLLYQSSGRSIFEESEMMEDHASNKETTMTSTTGSEIEKLQLAMEYAIASYYVNDPERLLELLNEKSRPEGSKMQLLQHSINTRPGSVGHFMALCETTRTVWIGCKGTSSIEDVFTDSCGRSVSYDPYATSQTESYSRVEVSRQQHQVLIGDSSSTSSCSNEATSSLTEDLKSRDTSCPAAVATSASTTDAIEVVRQDHDEIHVVDHGQDDVDAHIRCHEGIYIAAKRLFEKVHDRVVELVVKGDYRLELTGHSLGAGAVCLLAVMLKSRYPSLVVARGDGGRALDNSRSAVNELDVDDDAIDGEQKDSKMQVYAFAPPPVLDHDTAFAARRYITSVVQNADLIPRSSLANVAVLLEVLRTVSQRLVELNKAPRNVVSTTAFLRMLSRGSEGDPILSAEQVQQAVQAAHDKIELRHIDHLYVPGRVLLIYDHQATETVPNVESTAMSDDECAAVQSSSQTMDTSTGREIDDDSKRSVNSGCSNTQKEERTDSEWCMVDADATLALIESSGPFCAVTEGTTPALRSFQVDGFRMLGDHTSGAYLASINALALKEQSLRRLYERQRSQKQLLLQSDHDDNEKGLAKAVAAQLSSSALIEPAVGVDTKETASATVAPNP